MPLIDVQLQVVVEDVRERFSDDCHQDQVEAKDGVQCQVNDLWNKAKSKSS